MFPHFAMVCCLIFTLPACTSTVMFAALTLLKVKVPWVTDIRNLLRGKKIFRVGVDFVLPLSQQQRQEEEEQKEPLTKI